MTSGPEEIIERALVRIRREQQAHRLQQRAGAGKADAARYRYLDALDDIPEGRPISGIADAIGVDRPRASRLTTELLTEGLVARTQDPADSRYARIRLTPAGQSIVDTIHDARREAVSGALAGFTPGEAQTLATLLTRMVNAWPASRSSG